MMNNQYAMLVKKAAQQTGLPEELIDAQIKQESGYNPKAVSPAGAQGMMQLMPGTAKELGVTDPFDPEQNIMAGSNYLKRQLDTFGSLPKALAAYNAGPGNVKKYGGVPPFKETQGYISKIMGGLGDDVRQKYPSFQWGDAPNAEQNRFSLSDEPPKSNFALSNGGMEPQTDQGQQQASAIVEMLKAAGMDPESQKKQRRGDLVQDIASSISAMAAGLRRDDGKAQQGILQGMMQRQEGREERKQGAIAKLMEAYKSGVIKPTDDQQEYEFAKKQGYTGNFVDYMKSIKGGGQGPSDWEKFKWDTTQHQRQEDLKRQGTKDLASFRQEFNDLPQTKYYNKALNGITTLRKAAQNPNQYDDQAIVFNFMKAVDPESTVREGEFQAAQTNAPLLARFGIVAEQLKTGKLSLTKEQRQALVDAAERQFSGHEETFNQSLRGYLDLAEKNKYDFKEAFPSFQPEIDKIKNPKKEGQGQQAQKDSILKQVMDYVLNPQGGGQPAQTPQSAQPQPTAKALPATQHPELKAALAWAQQNPNDPRAVEVLRRAGVK